jgi:hypothetical protein
VNALTDTPFSLLLMGLITLAALSDWIQRRGLPPLWWRLLVRAFTGAGVYCLLGLSWLVVWESAGGWSWTPALPIGAPGEEVENSGVLMGFLLAYTGLVLLFPIQMRRKRRAPSDRREPGPRLSPLPFLFVGLAVVLLPAWTALSQLDGEMWRALGLRSRCHFAYVVAFWVPPEYGHLRDVALLGLEVFSWVTISLWVFLWGRAMMEQHQA